MTSDQKRALGIGAAGIGGLLLWRRAHSTGSSVSSGPSLTNGVANSSATGSIAASAIQSPIVVPAGESIYDPNSEALLNTPTAVPTPQVVTPAAPGYTVNVNYPKKTVTKKKAAKKPAKRKVSVKKKKVAVSK